MQVVESLLHLFHPRRSNNHRPRILHPEALVILLFIALAGFGLVRTSYIVTEPRGAVLGYASNISTTQVVEYANRERQREGLSALTMNEQLSRAAEAKAQDMFANQYWAHTSPTGKEPWDFIRASGYRYRVAGENLARDFQNTAEMTSAWMASPTHRANIMNAKYNEIGVAVVNGVMSGTETTLVVQMFGTPATAQLPAPTVTQQAAAVEVGGETGSGSSASAPVAAQLQASPVVPPAVPPTTAPNVIDLQPVIANQQTQIGEPERTPRVLARFLIPEGALTPTIVYSPLQLLKAFFMAIIMLLSVVLLYDMMVIGNKANVRLVGKNLAHLLLFFTVAFLLLFFKSGMIN